MGRPVGSKGKPKRMLTVRLQELYGDDFNPVVKMAGNAVTLQNIAQDAIEFYNKALQEIQDGGASILDEEAVKELMKMTQRMSQTATDAINGWDRVAQYVQPKMKTIEHTGADGSELVFNANVSFK
jgi:hypothetical protein